MKTELNPNDSGLNLGKIVQLLDHSARQLDEQTLSALGKARRNALDRQLAHSPIFALDAGRVVHRLIPHSAQQWLVAGLLLVAIVAGAGLWHHSQEQQFDELDVAILTDELPIEVFVD